MLVVALLLLPVMGLLLIGMDRVEDRLNGRAASPAGRHRGHLRLIHGQKRTGRRDAAPQKRRSSEKRPEKRHAA